MLKSYEKHLKYLHLILDAKKMRTPQFCFIPQDGSVTPQDCCKTVQGSLQDRRRPPEARHRAAPRLIHERLKTPKDRPKTTQERQGNLKTPKDSLNYQIRHKSITKSNTKSSRCRIKHHGWNQVWYSAGTLSHTRSCTTRGT